MDDRPSWIADTLSDEQPSLALELAALSADLDHLDAVLSRFEHESDKPPPDNPPPAVECPEAA